MACEYIFCEKYLQTLWQLLLHDFRSVALYGAGQHTRWLLERVIPIADRSRIRLILDDNAEPGTALDNIPMIRPEQYAPAAAEVVLISSDTHAPVMSQNVRRLQPRAPVVEPYADIGTGPFWNPDVAGDLLARNHARLAKFKDKHKNQRAFIVGNGPSLRRTDLTKLRGEITFGLNRIYLLEPPNYFDPTYYVCVNPYVAEQFSAEILRRVHCPKFLSVRWADRFGAGDDIFYFDHDPYPKFQVDMHAPLWIGATVTYVAMQIAFYMGFDEIILIGVDHAFKTPGAPHALVESDGADPNHFDPNYFGKGVKWQLPDLATSELAYRLAKFAYEQAGRKITDATVGGKLKIFTKVDYVALWDARTVKT